jgi:hypothetical protein
LHSIRDLRDHARQRMVRRGDRLNIEPDTVAIADDDERFLAGLGMYRERAVRKPASIGLMDDRDDSTRHVDETDGQRCAHRNVRANVKSSVSNDTQPGLAVHIPNADRADRIVERAIGEVDAPPMPSQALRNDSME